MREGIFRLFWSSPVPCISHVSTHPQFPSLSSSSTVFDNGGLSLRHSVIKRIRLVACQPISTASTYIEHMFRQGTESRFWELEWPKKETAVTVVSMTPCYCDGTAVTGMTPCYCDVTAVTDTTQSYCDCTTVIGMAHSVHKFRVTLHMFTYTQSKESSNSRCQYFKQLKWDYHADAVKILIKWICWAQAVPNGPSNTIEQSNFVKIWRIQAMSWRQVFNARYQIRKERVKCLTDQHSYMARRTIPHKQRNADLADLTLGGVGTQVKSDLSVIRTRPQLERRNTVISMFSFNFHYRACHHSFFRMCVVYFNDITVTVRFGRRMTVVWKTLRDSEDLTDLLFQYLKKMTKALKSCQDSRCSCWDSERTPAEITSTALPLRDTRSLQGL